MNPANPTTTIIYSNIRVTGMSTSTPGVSLKPGARIYPDVTNPFPLSSKIPKEVQEQIRKMKAPVQVRLSLHCTGSLGFLPDMYPIIDSPALFRGCIVDIGSFAEHSNASRSAIHLGGLANEILAQKPLQIVRFSSNMVMAVIVHNDIVFTCDMTPYADSFFDFAE